MCGIWASINAPDAVSGLDAAAHRGPDGEGWARFDTPAGRLEMGHKRLAIYDPTPDSSQPIQTADKRYTLIFNGALYNYRELREELAAKGYNFQTTGDAEVFLNAFVEWGPACFAKIDGMFAAVFYDADRQELTAARDRFGEKPLFVECRTGNRLVFASELPQLPAGLHEPPLARRRALFRFLESGLVERGDGSFVDTARTFPAAHWIEIDLSKHKLPVDTEIDYQAVQFWQPPKPAQMDEEAAIKALRAAMDEAIGRQLVADVPVGGCLSGGLDSSIILGTVDQLRGDQSDPFICVSAIFDAEDDAGNSLSERPFVDAVIKGKNVELIEVHPTEDEVVDRLDEIILTQGEPFPGTSICAQFFVFEAARKAGIKVMLDGQGADELFAGYAPMTGYAMADRLARLDPAVIGEFEKLVESPSDLNTSTLLRGMWRALVSERARRAVFKAIGRYPPKGGPVTEPALPAPFSPAPGESRLDTLIQTLVLRDSLPGLLRYEDRNAMAFAVETRLPFLSKAVADLAFQIPGDLKVKNGFTKYILRKAFEDRLPPEIAWRRKKLGFVTPQRAWMRGRLGQWVDLHLAEAIEKLGPLLNPDWIQNEHARMAERRTPGDTAFRVAMAGRWLTLQEMQLYPSSPS
ncbi:asparagine synthase (glutamine-hydrolyzing) [Hyphobacterium sp.]|uniref:asparagine synthase (glutamine-hydrolyzing) n=1 Tax=Hyphobacterium sp. TaxID=2004662 RepID=UPI003BAC0B77